MKILRITFVTVALLSLMACAARQETTAPAVISDADIIAQLAGPVWVAEYIHGTPVIDMTHTSMVFTTDDSVAGSGGCNRFKGSYELKDGTISFSPLGSTMKMCPDAISDQEMRFFQSLVEPQAVSFKNGLLSFSPAEGKPSVFAVGN